MGILSSRASLSLSHLATQKKVYYFTHEIMVNLMCFLNISRLPWPRKRKSFVQGNTAALVSQCEPRESGLVCFTIPPLIWSQHQTLVMEIWLILPLLCPAWQSHTEPLLPENPSTISRQCSDTSRSSLLWMNFTNSKPYTLPASKFPPPPDGPCPNRSYLQLQTSILQEVLTPCPRFSTANHSDFPPDLWISIPCFKYDFSGASQNPSC